MFTRELLQENNIPLLHLRKKDFLFCEDQQATQLFYLFEGSIKVYNIDSDGKEFLISTAAEHQFLGEPPFMLAERYPANAICTSDTAKVYSFSEALFTQFMIGHPELLIRFTQEIARKAYDKTMKLKSIVHQCPRERIISFLKIHKRNIGVAPEEKVLIDVTRKDVANATGLAVETVIRTVKKMENEKRIELINHKIYY